MTLTALNCNSFQTDDPNPQATYTGIRIGANGGVMNHQNLADKIGSSSAPCGNDWPEKGNSANYP